MSGNEVIAVNMMTGWCGSKCPQGIANGINISVRVDSEDRVNATLNFMVDPFFVFTSTEFDPAMDKKHFENIFNKFNKVCRTLYVENATGRMFG